jgi:hypothetical protein
MDRPGCELRPPLWKPATNRLSYGMGLLAYWRVIDTNYNGHTSVTEASVFTDETEGNCHFPTPGWNCMTHQQALWDFAVRLMYSFVKTIKETYPCYSSSCRMPESDRCVQLYQWTPFNDYSWVRRGGKPPSFEIPVLTGNRSANRLILTFGFMLHVLWPISQPKSGQLQWPYGLWGVISWTAQTMGSWIRIPLKAWVYVCVFLCFFCPLYVKALRWTDPPVQSPTKLLKILSSFGN